MGKKVVIFGVFNDPNLGDRLLCLSAGKLIEQMSDATIEYVDFYAREALSPKYPRVHCENTAYSVTWSKFYSAFHKLCSLMSLMSYPIKELGCEIEWHTDPNRKRRLERFYDEKIRDASVVIVPGGGILEDSVQHDYYHNLNLMASVCEKRKVPFCLNSVGVVHDVRARLGQRLLKKAISADSIKYISCRDGEAWVKENARCTVEKAACSATLSAELLNIKKDENSNVIGIGVIRGNIFTSYANSMSEDELVDFYCDLVKKVEEKGYVPKLFSNGFIKDYELGEKICERLGKSILLKRAESAEELVGQVSGFKAVCVARLHATIVAYSLDIPAVVFSWGTKQRDFMKNVGCEERAVSMENMNVDYVTELMEKAIKEGWDENVRDGFVKSGVDSIRKILAIGGL